MLWSSVSEKAQGVKTNVFLIEFIVYFLLEILLKYISCSSGKGFNEVMSFFILWMRTKDGRQK